MSQDASSGITHQIPNYLKQGALASKSSSSRLLSGPSGSLPVIVYRLFSKVQKAIVFDWVILTCVRVRYDWYRCDMYNERQGREDESKVLDSHSQLR